MKAALLYLLLASTYALYFPHARFLLDDWGVVRKYQQARDGGAREKTQVAVALVQNRFHEQFRFQWLSFSIGYLLFLLAGPSPGVMYAALVLVHAGCAIVLRQAVEKLGIGPGPAFLSGLVFLLLPATHGALLWSLNCSFFVWPTLWFLLYLRSLAGSLTSGKLDRKAAAQQALFLLLALFSGDPIFGLLLAAAPLTAWFLRSRLGWKATLLAWATVGTAATTYAALINRVPLFQKGVGLRYGFTFDNLKANLLGIVETYRRLSGLGDAAFYDLRLTRSAIAAAVLAAAAAVVYLHGTRRAREPGRALLLAAGLWVAAYGPIWFVLGHELRYDYVPSPYLALALSLAVLSLPGLQHWLAGALAGWLGVATVANLQQCWIPQSRNLDAIGERLRQLQRVGAGDLIVVSGAPLWAGTAPHFAFLTGWASAGFAEHVTGVRGLEAAREIVNEEGRLRAFHRTYIRDLEPGELARTHVLVAEPVGRFSERRLLAQEVQPGGFRVHPLRNYAGPPPLAQLYSREQLVMSGEAIYFARNLTDHSAALDW